MPIVSAINLLQEPEKHVLSIRTVIPFIEYSETAGKVYAKIIDYAQRNGILFSGAPFVCYHNTDMEHLDVEMGFPIANVERGDADILCHTISAQNTVSGIFLGAYEETDCLMSQIFRWIAEHGYEQQGIVYHHYLNEQNRLTCELLTRIAIPVK